MVPLGGSARGVAPALPSTTEGCPAFGSRVASIFPSSALITHTRARSSGKSRGRGVDFMGMPGCAAGGVLNGLCKKNAGGGGPLVFGV